MFITQQQKIVKYLSKNKYRTIRTLASSLRTKPNAVRARVAELRREGLTISTIKTKTGKNAYQLTA